MKLKINSSAPKGGNLQIKTKSVGIIRGGCWNHRRQHTRRGFPRGEIKPTSRRCYNCDQPQGHTPEHGSSVGWIDRSEAPSHSCDSESSKDYLVMSVRSMRCTELKFAGARLLKQIHGKTARVWIHSGSPISILTIGELKNTFGASNVRLEELIPEGNEFHDYGINPLKLMGTLNVRLELNDWETIARIRVIEDNRRVPITLQEKTQKTRQNCKIVNPDTSKNWKSVQINTSFRQIQSQLKRTTRFI